MIVRTSAEINELWERVDAFGASKWPGMSYESGIDAVLRWLTDKDAPDPMED